MPFITKVDLSRQGRIYSGDTANLDGSMSIGTNLILSGTPFNSDNSYSILVLNSGSTVQKIPTSSISGSLQQELQVNIGENLGGINDLQIFPTGTTFESMWRNLLIRAIPPTYTQPSASLSSNVSTSGIEMGTIISPTLNITFNSGNSGGEISRSLLKNSVQIATATPYTDSTIQVGSGATTYIASVTYSQGACLNNNLGVPDCTGRINSGTTNTNNIVYLGYRNCFYGFNVNPTSSSIIRGLTPIFNPQNGTTFTITIPIGITSVCFSYPSNLEDVSSVKYVELSNSEVKGNFIQTIVTVEAANAYAPTGYKVYNYTPVEAFSQQVHYIVTI